MVTSCDYSTVWLPGNTGAHIFSTLFSYRLHKTFGVSITFWRAYERVHHLIFSNTFPAIFCLDIDGKEIPIWSPWEFRIFRKSLLILIQGNLINKIKLHIKLNKRPISSNNIEILLSGRHRGSCDTILILGLNLDNLILIDGKNTSLLGDT